MDDEIIKYTVLYGIVRQWTWVASHKTVNGGVMHGHRCTHSTETFLNYWHMHALAVHNKMAEQVYHYCRPCRHLQFFLKRACTSFAVLVFNMYMLTIGWQGKVAIGISSCSKDAAQPGQAKSCTAGCQATIRAAADIGMYCKQHTIHTLSMHHITACITVYTCTHVHMYVLHAHLQVIVRVFSINFSKRRKIDQ